MRRSQSGATSTNGGMIGALGAAGDAGLGGADRGTEATPARLGGARDPT
ncbi:hypothetical protein [Streptomyces sp. SD15]